MRVAVIGATGVLGTAAVRTLISAGHRVVGLAGRRRAVEEFGWDAVAARTVDLYRSLVAG